MTVADARAKLVTDVVNASFAEAQEGFVNTHNAPAMTTPTVAAAAEVVITGSTICLGC